MDRREFLKLLGVTAGGVAVTSSGLVVAPPFLTYSEVTKTRRPRAQTIQRFQRCEMRMRLLDDPLVVRWTEGTHFTDDGYLRYGLLTTVHERDLAVIRSLEGGAEYAGILLGGGQPRVIDDCVVGWFGPETKKPEDPLVTGKSLRRGCVQVGGNTYFEQTKTAAPSGWKTNADLDRWLAQQRWACLDGGDQERHA